MEKATRLLLNCGAVPVIAHPLDIDVQSIVEHLAKFKDMGVIGVEVNYDYSHLSIKQNPNIVKEIAKELDLIGTGGTDYHGEDWRVPIGAINVSIQVVHQLKQAAEELGNDVHTWDT